ncbi:DUF4240 domain-containing protein [Amycolatopsis taiwanensis]|uniref:DUF4240 domain-containing protein n=1 Tax=Amycolatopsis taiwanensis TaxID=342230 RepID=A0A9W6VHP3_9PSEU|nr:DUF4240 domain-containing protein [Amycolatopsis taiwanensis]GLY68915.1 hypothetical protein Atai01_55340 [Amycolatopsis taiwanensis]
MDIRQFWTLIDDARSQVPAPADSDAVAGRASTLLAACPREEIVATQQVIWDLMADSYRNPLWAAAYMINGGCSDDGFDYFRGWLIAQGRDVFEQAVADPDALADLPSIRAAAVDGAEMECEDTLSIAWNAHLAATGEQVPTGSYTVEYPELDSDWNFDFDDRTEMKSRLPRLAALYLD